MEILKNCAKWYIYTSWSNQIAIGIIIIAIMTLTTKYGLMKMGWSWLKISSPWKIFGKIVSLAAIVGICYGGYLLACYLRPTPERLVFKELSKNLAEIELKPEKDKLAALNAKIEKGELLTETEKREAMEADKKIERVRKDYSDGKLAPPLPSVKPKEEVWIFAWMATDELMNENPQQKPSSEYVASDVAYSEKELSFVCFKGSRREDKIVLTRSNSDEHYLGYVFNKKEEKYNPIRLLPENGNYKGYISIKKGEKILATLKKQSH